MRLTRKVFHAKKLRLYDIMVITILALAFAVMIIVDIGLYGILLRSAEKIFGLSEYLATELSSWPVVTLWVFVTIPAAYFCFMKGIKRSNAKNIRDR